MGFRDTGKIETKTAPIRECFCDACGVTIPDGNYPEFELNCQWAEYRHDDDSGSESYDLCSLECVARKARDLADGVLTNRVSGLNHAEEPKLGESR